jgi:hypothetical protein
MECKDTDASPESQADLEEDAAEMDRTPVLAVLYSASLAAVLQTVVPWLARNSVGSYLFCGIPYHVTNNLRRRHPHREILISHIEHVFHAGIHAFNVQIGGDGIGCEAGFVERNGCEPDEAGLAMPTK